MFFKLLQWGKEFAVLASLYMLGDFLSHWLGLLLPGSIVGMLLLLILLFSGILKLEQIEKLSDALLRHLNLLFLPAAVGIMVYAKNFSGNIIEILLIVLFSTVVVLAVTGKTVDWVIDLLGRSVKERGSKNV